MAYTTLDKLKGQLGITPSDVTRDTLLTDALDAVSEAIDNMSERSFTAATGVATTRTFQTRGRTQTTPDGWVLVTPDIGSATGLALATGTVGGTYTPTTGTLELYPVENLDEGWPATGVLLVGSTWPTGSGARVQITADWGWPAVPAVVEQATLIQAARIFKRKDSPEGVLGSAEWGAVRVSRVDPDVEAMLAPLRLDVALVG